MIMKFGLNDTFPLDIGAVLASTSYDTHANMAQGTSLTNYLNSITGK